MFIIFLEADWKMPEQLIRIPTKPLTELCHAKQILGYKLKKFDKAVRKVKCPACNFVFDLTYARAIACQGCPEAIYNCDFVRCPKCDLEFKVTGSPIAKNEGQSRSVRSYVSETVDNYLKTMGESPKR